MIDIKLQDTHSSKTFIVSFIQDLIKRKQTNETQTLSLKVYAYISNKWEFYNSYFYDKSLQWCLRLTLKHGKYLFIYESGFELAQDLPYCFRVLTDAK